LWITVFVPLLELNLIGNVDVNYFVSGKLIFKKVNQAIVRNILLKMNTLQMQLMS